MKEMAHVDVKELTNSVSSEGAASKVFSDERNVWISRPRGADCHPSVNGPSHHTWAEQTTRPTLPTT